MGAPTDATTHATTRCRLNKIGQTRASDVSRPPRTCIRNCMDSHALRTLRAWECVRSHASHETAPRTCLVSYKCHNTPVAAIPTLVASANTTVMAEWDESPSSGEKSGELTRTSEYRKIVKPLLEKRRRARMNLSLNELKAYIVDARKSEISDPSKLEKADILELTVRHLRDLRRQQRSVQSMMASGADASRYSAGFSECAHEVSIYLSALPGLDNGLKARLLTHLAMCIHQVDRMTTMKMHPHQVPVNQQIHHISTEQSTFDTNSSLAKGLNLFLDSTNHPSATNSRISRRNRPTSPVWRPW